MTSQPALPACAPACSFEKFLWSRLRSTRKGRPVEAVVKSGRHNIYGLVASCPLVAELQAQEEQRRQNLGQQQQQQPTVSQ